MGDWGDKIQYYQEMINIPDDFNDFKFRNPIIFWKHFFNELGLDGFIIICLISLILLLFLKKNDMVKITIQ